MFFEELDLAHVFNMMNYSRYLFLDFLEAHSLLIVGNQGSYDLHFFRVINALGRFKIQREYVYKADTPSIRLLGVSVQRSGRVYVLGSDKRLSVIEVRDKCD